MLLFLCLFFPLLCLPPCTVQHNYYIERIVATFEISKIVSNSTKITVSRLSIKRQFYRNQSVTYDCKSMWYPDASRTNSGARNIKMPDVLYTCPSTAGPHLWRCWRGSLSLRLRSLCAHSQWRWYSRFWKVLGGLLSTKTGKGSWIVCALNLEPLSSGLRPSFLTDHVTFSLTVIPYTQEMWLNENL